MKLKSIKGLLPEQIHHIRPSEYQAAYNSIIDQIGEKDLPKMDKNKLSLRIYELTNLEFTLEDADILADALIANQDELFEGK